MKRSAVIFVLIITLLTAGVCAGCADGQPTGGPQAGGAGSPASEAGGGNTGSPESPDSANGAGSAENQSGTGEGSPQDPSPYTDQSAVSDWGSVSPGAGGGRTLSSFSKTLVDTEDLYWAIKEVRADAAGDYCWEIYIENRTDKNLMFSLEKVSVNGVMCDPYWAEVVTAGRKGNCEIIWMRDSLDLCQIGDVAEVDFTLNVYNDDDYTEAPLLREPFTVYPLGGDKADSVYSERTPAASDTVLVDNDACEITVTGCDPDNTWGYAVHLYLRNKSDQDLIYSASGTEIGGIPCEAYWTEVVSAGRSAYSTILWDKAALKESGISEVKEISLPLLVFSDRDISAPYVDETFEVTP